LCLFLFDSLTLNLSSWLSWVELSLLSFTLNFNNLFHYWSSLVLCCVLCWTLHRILECHEFLRKQTKERYV
jgi:hypothetical protein